LVVTGSQGQLDLWKLGAAFHGGMCLRYGRDISGLIPGLPKFEDPWFVLLPDSACNTQGGSISCQNEKLDEDFQVIVGSCECNQGDDHELFQDPNDMDVEYCVGKVGAKCTPPEYNGFIPEKKCVDNAQCIPEQGKGYSVGRCKCMYGYEPTPDGSGNCQLDGNDLTTTEEASTTEFETTPPPPPPFELPPLNLLIGMSFTSKYGDECNSGALLKKSYCAAGRTVSCIARKCQCNMMEDSIFDENLDQCVGKAGAYCLARKNFFGWKACTQGADCFVEDGTTFQKSSFGICECLYGYTQEADGTCKRDPSIPYPSTKRPGGPTPKPSPTTPEVPTSPPSTSPTSPPDQANFNFQNHYHRRSWFRYDHSR